jgi:hypothetical protein
MSGATRFTGHDHGRPLLSVLRVFKQRDREIGDITAKDGLQRE